MLHLRDSARCALVALLVGVFVVPAAIESNPVTAAVGDGWVNIDVGDRHTCGVTRVGEAFCWGNGDNDQLGGATPGPAPAELPTIAGVTWASIDTGSYHSCAITTGGDIYCWGVGTWGQIGNGDAPPVDFYPTPQLVVRPVGATWADVSAGYGHTCALTTGGDLYCWGRNVKGQLGVGDETDRSAPTLVPREGGVPWAKIDAGTPDGNNFGGQTTCAITAAGTAFCWGDDRDGELGNDLARTDSNVPVPVVDIGQPWASIRVGLHHTCGVGRDGAGWCWGNNASLQLGLGAGSLVDIAPVPESVVTPVGVEWALIDPGSFLTCGITLDGAMYCWGSESFNFLLGDGNMTPDQYPEPNLVVTEPGVVWADVEVSWSHACAIDTTGAGWCWGSDSWGVLGNGGAVDIDLPQPTLVGNRTGGPQVIRFFPESDKFTTDPPFSVSPDAESGLPVSVAAAGSCTIEFDRLVTLTGPGTCSLTATQAGDADWLPAPPVTRSFAVTSPVATPPVLSVTFTPNPVLVGETSQLVLTIDNSANSVAAEDLTLVSDRFFMAQTVGTPSTTCGGVVSDSAEELTLTGGSVGPGASCTVTADVSFATGGSQLYEADNFTSSLGASAPASMSLFVDLLPQTISFDPIADTPLSAGSVFATVSASSGRTVELSPTGSCTSDAPEAVEILLTSIGTCTVTATQLGSPAYAPAEPVVVEFEVVRPRPQFEVVGPGAATLVGTPASFVVDLDLGALPDATGTVRFEAASGQTADVVLVNGIATWTLSDLPVGVTVVTAAYLGDADYAPSAASVDASHEVVPAPLSLTGLPAEVDVGEVVTVTATGFHAGETITFVLNSDPVIVGRVTSTATGSATLTFDIPSVDAGTHELTATGASSGIVASAGTTIQGAPTTTSPPTTTTPTTGSPVPDMGSELPRTGQSSSVGVLWAFVLSLLGGALLIAARRRRSAAVV